MLEYFLVTLLPAAAILGIVLVIRMQRAIRSIRHRAKQDPEGWRREPDDANPQDILWRRAYRG